MVDEEGRSVRVHPSVGRSVGRQRRTWKVNEKGRKRIEEEEEKEEEEKGDDKTLDQAQAVGVVRRGRRR
jgi:hypothetical protein